MFPFRDSQQNLSRTTSSRSKSSSCLATTENAMTTNNTSRPANGSMGHAPIATAIIETRVAFAAISATHTRRPRDARDLFGRADQNRPSPSYRNTVCAKRTHPKYCEGGNQQRATFESTLFYRTRGRCRNVARQNLLAAPATVYPVRQAPIEVVAPSPMYPRYLPTAAPLRTIPRLNIRHSPKRQDPIACNVRYKRAEKRFVLSKGTCRHTWGTELSSRRIEKLLTCVKNIKGCSRPAQTQHRVRKPSSAAHFQAG